MKLFYFFCFFCSFFLCIVVSVRVPDRVSKPIKIKTTPDEKHHLIDATIYEKDPHSGRSVSYKKKSSVFYDLRPIVESFANKQISLVCITGSWLLYSLPELKASALTDVKLLTGEAKCALPATKIGSIQPIGPMSQLITNSITLFKHKYFSAEGVSIKETMTSDKFKLLVSRVDSFIVTGHSKWTLVVDFAQSICVSVKTTKSLPICYMPYFEIKPFTRIFEVRKGCDEGKTRYSGHITLEECSSFGSGVVESIDIKYPPKLVKTTLGFFKPKGGGLGDYLKSNSKMSGKAMQLRPVRQADYDNEKAEDPSFSACISKEPEVDSDGDTMCYNMLSIRMTQAVDIMERNTNLKLPTNPEDIWKTELFDYTIRVALGTCPFEVVVPEYLKMAGELFVYHLNRVWEQTSDLPQPNISEDVWRKVVLGTKICSQLAHNYGKTLQEEILMAYTLTNSPTTISSSDNPTLQLDREKDTVIEYIWLVANHVAAICHHAHDYEDDFMDQYTTVFHEMYLIPLMSQWNKPGSSLSRCYNHILGGYDMDNQYQRMRICTEKSLGLTNNLEPWDKNWMNASVWATRK